MTTALYVSLGHNSSAVLSRHNSVVAGYEQERLDRIKSSSHHPREAIERCANFAENIDVAFVSHWFDDFNLVSNKYFDRDHLLWYTDEIVGLTPSFTHHDAHASSALQFYRCASGRALEDADIVVMDGFGNRQECLSVYSVHGLAERPTLTHRTYGYNNSLGLMYQYATSWLGLKMNQDEYKLLGYESHVLSHISYDDALVVRRRMMAQAREHVSQMLSPQAEEMPFAGEGLFDLKALQLAQSMWFERCAGWRRLFPLIDSEDAVKACIAYCAQTFIEECTVLLIEELAPTPMGKPAPVLILAGGCFYNVKLNRRIATDLRRRIFPHPLSGDQGAAMGHAVGLHTNGGLGWGDRIILGRDGQVPIGVEVVDADAWTKRAVELLEADRIVNVVRGGMEYGPRTLCNTTTFALPTRENVRRINALNERDEAMPMAPVLTQSAAHSLFLKNDVELTQYANRFMITTCAFNVRPHPKLMGVAHKDPLDEYYTARPQVVSDYSELGKMLLQFPHETLINTSFNYHGEPIVYSEDDACKTHSMQCLRAQTLGLDAPITLLVRS